MKDPNVRPKRVCSPKYAVQKARKGAKLNRWELEDLAKSPLWSLEYARKVLKGRFPEGEAAIGSEPGLAFAYAKEIVKGAFPEGEQAILDQKDRWGNRPFLKRYIIDVAGVRNEKFETSLLKEVRKGNEANLSIEYARKCIGGRWEEIEPYILKEDLGWASQYHSTLYKERWPALEDRILFKKKKNRWEDRKDAWKDYIKSVGPSKEIEAKLMRTSKANLILIYAAEALKGRLPPELHQKMTMFSFDPKKSGSSKAYFKWIDAYERRVLKYLSGLNDEERQALLLKVS